MSATSPRLVAAALVLVAAAGCGGDRPSVTEWTAEWDVARALVPSTDELAEGGQALCDELLGEMRQTLTRLDPTPTEALDDVVDTWVKAAESMVFDCPSGEELADRTDELDSLTAEVEAGLESAGTG